MKKNKDTSTGKVGILIILIIVFIVAVIKAIYYNEMSGRSGQFLGGQAGADFFKASIVAIISFICLFVYFVYNSIRGWNKK